MTLFTDRQISQYLDKIDYRGGKVVERQELQTNREVVTLLKDTFGIQVPDSYQNFLYRQEE